MACQPVRPNNLPGSTGNRPGLAGQAQTRISGQTRNAGQAGGGRTTEVGWVGALPEDHRGLSIRARWQRFLRWQLRTYSAAAAGQACRRRLGVLEYKNGKGRSFKLGETVVRITCYPAAVANIWLPVRRGTLETLQDKGQIMGRICSIHLLLLAGLAGPGAGAGFTQELPVPPSPTTPYKLAGPGAGAGSAQAQSVNPALPAGGACVLPAPACQQPPRVVVHVAKPEIVYEDDSTDNCKEKKRIFRLRKHHKPAPSPSPPAVGTILAPSPAFVPLAPAPMAPPSSPSCNNSRTEAPNALGSAADLPSMRAANDVALALARLRIAQAALQAEQSSLEASLKRIGEATAPIFNPPKPKANQPTTPQAPPDTSAAADLKIELENIKKAISTLNTQLSKHQQVLEKHFASDMKDPGA